MHFREKLKKKNVTKGEREKRKMVERRDGKKQRLSVKVMDGSVGMIKSAQMSQYSRRRKTAERRHEGEK